LAILQICGIGLATSDHHVRHLGCDIRPLRCVEMPPRKVLTGDKSRDVMNIASN